MPISDWSDLLNDTVTVEPYTGRDVYGKPTYGTAVSFAARVVYAARGVITQRGETIRGTGEVWLSTTYVVAQQDRVTLPDGTSPAILDVARYPDEAGAHHVKLVFGAADNGRG